MAAIVIVIISRGMPAIPMPPRTTPAAKNNPPEKEFATPKKVCHVSDLLNLAFKHIGKIPNPKLKKNSPIVVEILIHY